jgi:hypothetical protein
MGFRRKFTKLGIVFIEADLKQIVKYLNNYEIYYFKTISGPENN